MKIQLDEFAITPTRAHDTDAGLDIYSPERKMVYAKSRVIIDTGVHVQIPTGCVGLLKSKSGLMCWNGITSEGTIDEGYTGSIKVCLINSSDEHYIVSKGDKISQLLVIPCRYEEVEVVDRIEGGERGEYGFGSTGR